MLAVLTVNSLLDTTVAADGLVTLREAIVASNTDGATDLGDMGSGADTIQFAAGLTGTITLAGTEIQITDAVTINGPGSANLTVAAAPASRIFNVTNDVGDATFKGLTLTGGSVAAGFGGGAYFVERVLVCSRLRTVSSPATPLVSAVVFTPPATSRSRARPSAVLAHSRITPLPQQAAVSLHTEAPH